MIQLLATVSALAFAISAALAQVPQSAGGDLAPVATSGSASDLSSGTLPAGRMPALTGDCTTLAGAVATSCKSTSTVVAGTRDLSLAGGTQVVSGFGFTPSACEGHGTTGAAASAYTTYSGRSDSSLNQSALYSSGGTMAINNSNFFAAVDATGGNYKFGAISNYASNQITITWAGAGAPTGTFSFAVRCFK